MWVCRTGGEAFERRLVYSVTLIIVASNNFVPLLKSFIVNGLKCKARLKQILNACALLCVP